MASGPSSGDASVGCKVFKQRCVQCHTTEAGGGHRTGPSLAGLFGRKTGQVPGYNYTEANKKKGKEASFTILGYKNVGCQMGPQPQRILA